MSSKGKPTVAVGVDTGGTFTDFVYKTPEGWKVYKTLSTPENPAKAILEGLKVIGEDLPRYIVHGTTVATNTLLERKGAKTAFVTNKGFKDIIEIGRQNRESLYDLHYRREKPLVPRNLRFEIDCRVNSKGQIVKDIDPKEVEELIENLKKERVEAVAVCFLFSFLNPQHEKLVGKLIREKLKGVYVSVSSEILPEFREFERASTTVVNAYVAPKMAKYVTTLKESLSPQDRLVIMQSSGGVISADTVIKEPVRTVLSGPAGGVVGAWKIGKLAGFEKLITFDMGGTSTDVSLVDGKPSFTTETKISGIPIKVPMIEIHTVGAGGGSIVWIDEGGALKVGPQSAGANPGPICYGRGGKEITVTDTNLFLGRLVPDHFLGGNMKLHNEGVERAFKNLSEKLKVDPYRLAEGILEIANTKMEGAIRVISVQRGYNPSEFTLVSFGGAGGMHAVFLAKKLGIPRVLIPKNPGLLSAMGMLLADLVRDYSLTVMLPIEGGREQELYRHLKELFKTLENRALEEMEREGFTQLGKDLFLEHSLDVRYKGQSYEVNIPFTPQIREEFERVYKNLYGYTLENRPLEVVNIRLKAIGVGEKPPLPPIEKSDGKLLSRAVVGEQKTFFGGKTYTVKVIDRDKLLAGDRWDFPSIVVEYSSTLVIPPGCFVRVDEFGNLIVEVFEN
ncbi:MAG: hydantoinase/oxoprolinase family protein [Aquificaceae bacterium]|nr:MAG: hydantoinase/oxoprolinase family protein [Aquificaceae bacterium]